MTKVEEKKASRGVTRRTANAAVALVIHADGLGMMSLGS